MISSRRPPTFIPAIPCTQPEITLPAESVVLRRAATDGMILQQRGFDGWQPFDPLQPLPPQLAPYAWGKQAR